MIHLPTAWGLAVIFFLQTSCLTVSAQESTEPRIKPIPVAEMDAVQKEMLGIVDGEPLPGRAKMNLFRTFMHNPELMENYFPMGNRVSAAPEFPDKDRELIIMRIGWLYQGEYEWAQHYDPAMQAGWSAEEIERIKLGPGAAGWSEFERILLKAADQLVLDASLTDDVWAGLREQYSVQDIMVLNTLVAHYHWVAMMTKVLGIQIETGKQGFER